MKDVSQDEAPCLGADVHERESQVAVYDADGALLEKRLTTYDLEPSIDSLPGEKRVAAESGGAHAPHLR